MSEYDLDFEAMKSITRLSWLLDFEPAVPAVNEAHPEKAAG